MLISDIFGQVVSSHRRERKPRRPARLIVINVLALALLATGTAAYGALSKVVALTIDGQTTEVRTFASDVESVLDAHGIDLRGQDEISHNLSDSLADGDEVVIRYAKPVSVYVDGVEHEVVSHEATVGPLLDNLGVEVRDNAFTSHGPDDVLDRDGTTVIVSHPKDITVIADGQERKIETDAPTTRHVLADLGIRVGEDDEVEPSLSTPLSIDETVRVVRIEYVERTEVVEVDYDVEIEDSSELFEGRVEIVEEGEPGQAEEDVRLVLADGEERDREVIVSRTLTEPRPQIERHGTRPLAEVWDRLAQCESGGNWQINTGNGFYGGLQFMAATWHSVGGTGLPHEHSREEQIYRGMILQERAGWGQWPSCASRLGLR